MRTKNRGGGRRRRRAPRGRGRKWRQRERREVEKRFAEEFQMWKDQSQRFLRFEKQRGAEKIKKKKRMKTKFCVGLRSKESKEHENKFT